MSRQYIIVTLKDAKAVAAAFRRRLPWRSRRAEPIIERFERETGADLEDIVERLKGAEVCSACAIEGQASYCTAIETRAQGRRLRRLLERARGERTEGI